tara:strand:+ start:4909 stop:5271 length:363 start_codon:yes stop_codon:yes gene_type:complete
MDGLTNLQRAHAALVATDEANVRLRADLSAALAQNAALREAIERWRQADTTELASAEDAMVAALSTPAPAALEAMRAEIRDAALEEAAKVVETFYEEIAGEYFQTCQHAAAAIRAMKGEG